MTSQASRTGPPPTRSGLPLDVVTSALIKSLRRGQEEAAIAWAVELDESGYAAHLLRRLLIASVEDCSDADLPTRVLALYEMCQALMAKRVDKSAAYRLPLIRMVLEIVRAPKGRETDHCLLWAYRTPAPLPEVEEDSDVLDKHTAYGARELHRAWAHFFERSTLLVNEHGELVHEPVPDRYRDRARVALVKERKS